MALSWLKSRSNAAAGYAAATPSQPAGSQADSAANKSEEDDDEFHDDPDEEDGDGGADEFDDSVAELSTNKSSVVEAKLPFITRELKTLQARDFSVASSASCIGDVSYASSPPPKAAAWSPDGSALATVDPSKGLAMVCFPDGADAVTSVLDASATAVHMLQWSPKGSFLVTQSPPKPKDEQEDGDTNVQVWKRDADGVSFSCQAAFANPRREKGSLILQWMPDERVCCHLLPDGAVRLLDGATLADDSALALTLPLPAQALQFAPTSKPARLSVFMADTRDSLQRVSAPAKVKIFDASRFPEAVDEMATVMVKFGQQAEMQWSPSGSAVLVHCQTEVDDSGQSYYGDSKLMLISFDAQAVVDLTETSEQALGGGGSTIQDVHWSPTKDEFVLIQGFQPAKATCWAWDKSTNKCTQTAVLLPKAHRNTIRWNHFGSMVCIAGFGNLAGEVDFFARTKDETKGLVKVSSCEASCTVSAEWAPDGRHFMTAVLAPRMRVDNGLSVWRALGGTKVAELAIDELHEVQWKPEPRESSRFKAIPLEEIEHVLNSSSSSSAGASGKKQAYRPPSARTESAGAGSVSQMMKADADNFQQRESRANTSTSFLPKPTGTGSAEGAAPATRTLFDLERRLPMEETPVVRNNNCHGKGVCPETGWQYIDPKGNIQGPFILEKMQKWSGKNAFKSTLKLRCDAEDRFITMGELFPYPQVPFYSAPRRPQKA